MQIYVVRYNPFLYHLGLKLNVKPFPIICALLCLEKNKYGKERFIVGCLVFIKGYVWSLTKELKFSSILQTQESVTNVCFLLEVSSACIISGQHFPGMLSLCLGLPWLWAEQVLCLGSWSTRNRRCPSALCGFCCLRGVEPGGFIHFWWCCPQLSSVYAGCGCLQFLQFPWENCFSCGCSARDPDCAWDECKSHFCRGMPGLPYTSAECFHSPKDSECCLLVKGWMCPCKQIVRICL